MKPRSVEIHNKNSFMGAEVVALQPIETKLLASFLLACICCCFAVISIHFHERLLGRLN